MLGEGKTSAFWSIMVDELRAIAPNWGISTLAAGGVTARALSSRHNHKMLDALRNRASLLVTGKPAAPPRKVY